MDQVCVPHSALSFRSGIMSCQENNEIGNDNNLY